MPGHPNGELKIPGQLLTHQPGHSAGARAVKR